MGAEWRQAASTSKFGMSGDQHHSLAVWVGQVHHRQFITNFLFLKLRVLSIRYNAWRKVHLCEKYRIVRVNACAVKANCYVPCGECLNVSFICDLRNVIYCDSLSRICPQPIVHGLVESCLKRPIT